MQRTPPFDPPQSFARSQHPTWPLEQFGTRIWRNLTMTPQVAADNVTQVNRGATETGSASEEVLNSARTLSTESTRLREELDRFMANIRAA